MSNRLAHLTMYNKYIFIVFSNKVFYNKQSDLITIITNFKSV